MEFDPILWSKDDWSDYYKEYFNEFLLSKGSSALISTMPLAVEYYDNTTEDDNFVVSVYYASSFRYNYGGANRCNIRYCKWSVNLSLLEGRFCLVRIPTYHTTSDVTITYQYMYVGTSNDGLICDYHDKTEIFFTGVDNKFNTVTGEVISSDVGSVSSSNIYALGLGVVNTANIGHVSDRNSTSSEVKEAIRTLFSHAIQNNSNYYTLAPLNDNVICYGLNSSYSGGNQGNICSLETVPDFLPIFYIEDGVDNIINYLDYGDDSGKRDPFDPQNPEVVKVTDFKSNFVMNLSKVDNSTTKISVSMSNRQYIDGGVNTWGNYSTYLAKDDEAFSIFNFNNPSKYVQKQSQGVMTITYNEDLSARRYLGQNAFSTFLFGTNDVFNEDGSYNVDSSHSGIFTATLIPDSNSAVGVKLGKVYYQDFVSSLRTELSRQVYGEGYKFTYSDTGETLYVLFKAIDLDELKNIIDEGYPSEDDEEDDTTGDDNIALYGSGLRTYKISDNAFDEVNKTLWTTNWIEVFKSNTIDPLKCVISCKRIPFTVEGTPTDTLYLANRNIDIGLGSYVSPIKSFNCGRYTLEAIYGNFVDITMARIKVWLPYVGWKELPASEVVSRVARTQVGLTSNTKVLSFKYIVDFVDGGCRCVISVNDTERWCFDGNCGIDVPVTSDNHTSAVATALRSGATGVLKIAGGAVATAVGASTMNPMVLAGGVATAVSGQQDLFNAFPTYDYNTSTSPSGYIEGAMNKHIMIIIEYPNAYYPNYYEHKYGKPCYLNLSLGSCSGFTKTSNVDVSNIPCTTEEQEMIKQLLDSGVYF